MMTTSDRGRHYGMDWLRIAAFGLLILYHVGMAFVPWPFEIKVTTPIDWVAIPMLFTSPWRLSLLFAISGYASAAVLARGGGAVGGFVRGRLARLGLPLLFGMAVLVTPQPWIALVTQHGYPHGFIHFLTSDYYRFQFIHGVAMPTWMHLWFVAYLLAYTMILATLLCLPANLRQMLRRRVESTLASTWLLPLPILLIVLAREWLSPGWNDTHALVDDWSAHATYLPLFLFGALLRRSSAIQTRIARQWQAALMLSIASYVGLVVFELAYPGTTPVPGMLRPGYHLLRGIALWSFVIGLIGLADAHANRDHRWRATLTEAIFPFYLIHQTIILVVGYWLLATPTGALMRFVILVAGTAIGCWVFYAIGRRIAWLRPWIGLAPAKRIIDATPTVSAAATVGP
jgi:glucans biosynthesis protein C